MNLFGPTLVLYLLVGIGVAVALYLSDTVRPRSERLLRLATALPFWPFYLPILLARPASSAISSEDELEKMIVVVESELDTALAGLDTWVEDIPENHSRLIETLYAAWKAQAERIHEMDRLLSRSENSLCGTEVPVGVGPRVRQSLAAREQNLEQLRQIRRRSEANLLASVASVRELASRIHLARFADVPVPRAKELLAEIAAAVENLSAPSGSEEQVCSIKKAE